MDAAPLTPVVALFQVLPWSALICVVLSWTTAKRKVKPLGLRWALLLLLIWFIMFAMFVLLQYFLGASGRSEVVFMLVGAPVGYGFADLCVRRFWEHTSGQ
ncbi:hypothetical protein SBBP1_220007 [Burkholderiales bacterium]|nr:hypothetical protein SBBP1_220007 [Burkholderiales bacterium]